MDRKIIISKLSYIFLKAFNIDITKNEEYFDNNLLDDIWQFEAVDLLILFFAIESEFKVKFSDEDIIKERISTINNMVDMLSEKLCLVC